MPFFSKPFAGDFPIGNLFDHDKPLVFNDSNGYLLTLCGNRDNARDSGQTDGHDGYDWRMTEGTPDPRGGRWIGDVRRPAGAGVLPAAQPQRASRSMCSCSTARLTEPSSSPSTVTSRAWTWRRVHSSPPAPRSGSQATPDAAGRRICTSARFAAGPTELSR